MKRVYQFGPGIAEGDKSLVKLLGGKGANLAEMSRLDIPVPPGFTITTKVCVEFAKLKNRLPDRLMDEVEQNLAELERVTGKKFGDAKNPLLVSVRSGASVSMPGMMDTILNLGLTEDGVKGLTKASGNDRFAWDTYRRLLQMFGDVVLGISSEKFEAILEEARNEESVETDAQLSVSALQKVAERYRSLIGSFPEDPMEQLRLAIEAVFRSWNNPRAMTYRNLNNIPHDLGTAVTVQAMVFGNFGDDSATGVSFSRNPSTGEKGLMGEYLPNAQGEDVVAGIRTPLPINRSNGSNHSESFETKFPKLYRELCDQSLALEDHYSDMQDIEFTVERGKLWILQTRSGKRTAAAAVRIAVEMVSEKIMDRRAALLRVRPNDIEQLLHPIFDPKAKKEWLATGLPASPGAASGKIFFTAEAAEKAAAKGERVILVRTETSPEDIGGMHVSQGILTTRGGMTSHAAVVARGMGKCCIVGCSEIQVDVTNRCVVTAKGERLVEGTVVSLNGSTGEVLRGEVPLVDRKPDAWFGTFMAWADEVRSLKVRANADTPGDCRVAREFGAQGVGLCRTEHMFFDKKRIDIVRQMILSGSTEERKRFLEKILPMQLEDFVGIFREMRGLPVTIRLLDPPLHEFLPGTDREIELFAKRIEMRADELHQKIDRLREFNPMLGHRGCRLAITFPEIYEMQVRAIVTAACDVSIELREKVIPEIMVPLISDPKEFELIRKRVVAVAEEIKKERGVELSYYVGTMIELPRAAILADEIAKSADFFSFGTNDLTQTTFGLSRDDSARFIPAYMEEGILHSDPFAGLDLAGVGELVKLGTERGRYGNAKLKIGICGEHGGDPASISFFHSLGLNYVSCSPFRVPVARLAAAQATLHTQVSHD